MNFVSLSNKCSIFFKQWARDHYLNAQNLQYAKDVRQQLTDICNDQNIPIAKMSPPCSNTINSDQVN